MTSVQSWVGVWRWTPTFVVNRVLTYESSTDRETRASIVSKLRFRCVEHTDCRFLLAPRQNTESSFSIMLWICLKVVLASRKWPCSWSPWILKKLFSRFSRSRFLSEPFLGVVSSVRFVRYNTMILFNVRTVDNPT